MATPILSNFATSVLDSGITDVATSLTVSVGGGALFPNPGVNEYVILTLENVSGTKEIVHMTARAGDVMTIERAKEGTSAAAFIAGSKVELRLTKGLLESFSISANVQDSELTYVTTVAGTNTITGTLPSPFTAYVEGQMFTFVPAVTNTGAVTVNWSAIGAKAVQLKGAALVGGELVAGVPVTVFYTGSVFELLASGTSMVSPMTAAGDLIIGGTGGLPTRLAKGANGTLLGVVAGALTYTTPASAAFASGTRMLFQQTAAPTGWTKEAVHNNKALRVVSGTASSGGTVDFTTAFASGQVSGGTAISIAQMPSHTHGAGSLSGTTSSDGAHTHSITMASVSGGAGLQGTTDSGATFNTNSDGAHTHTITMSGGASGAQGGGGTHTHTIPDLAVSYIDVIVAVKD